MTDQTQRVAKSSPSIFLYAFFTFVVFLILKLTQAVDWSWWWVTAPLWITYGGLVVVLLIALTVVAVTGYGKSDNVNRNRLRGL